MYSTVNSVVRNVRECLHIISKFGRPCFFGDDRPTQIETARELRVRYFRVLSKRGPESLSLDIVEPEDTSIY